MPPMFVSINLFNAVDESFIDCKTFTQVFKEF